MNNTPMQYTAIFDGCKISNFQMKKDFFLIFAQNIDCGCTPRGGSYEYRQTIFKSKCKKCKKKNMPMFYYIKVGC